MAISLKREKVPEELPGFYGTQHSLGPGGAGLPKHQYRIIVRTSNVSVVRVVRVGGCEGGEGGGEATIMPERKIFLSNLGL